MNPDPSSQKSAPPHQVEASEIFKFCTNANLTRCQMQHKCGEMSLQVTAALGTAIAALMIAYLSKSGSSTGSGQSSLLTTGSVVSFIRALLFLYALIQSLITANYIYQTYQTFLLDLVYSQLTLQVAESVKAGIAGKVNSEFSPSRQPGWWLHLGWRVVTRSQPLIIGGLAFLGWVAFLWSILVWRSTASHWFLVVLVLLLPGLLFLCSGSCPKT